MRISDWISDLCSSDLKIIRRFAAIARLDQLARGSPAARRTIKYKAVHALAVDIAEEILRGDRRTLVLEPQRDRAEIGIERDIGPRVGSGGGRRQIGRAAGRERVGQYV